MSQRLKYKGITFDDFVDDRDDFRVPKYWSQVCESCYRKYADKLSSCADGAFGYGICGVEGCENAAEYYVDFDDSALLVTEAPHPIPAVNIGTLAERDKQLEDLWRSFSDVPMNPETECIEENFMHFAAGTNREEIWHWFDERHSKGVAFLLYPTENDKEEK